MIENLQAHYGFTIMPFGSAIPVPALFGPAAHKEAVARLRWLISARGLGVITGEAGSGKTAAVRAAADGLDPSPVCERCYADLHPGIPATVSYWSVRWLTYTSKAPEEQMPFTVIRSRGVTDRLSSRDEMYRPHLSQDGEVWKFTSALIEEARDGSMYDLGEISELEARAIMERTRAKYLPA